MNNSTKNMLLVFGEHLLFALLSLFLVYTFSNLLGKHIAFISIFTGVLYISSCYSAGWTLSGKDHAAAKEQMRVSGSDKLNYNIYRGFILALPNFLLGAVFTVLALTKGQMWEVLLRLYDYAFIYVITDKTNALVPLNMVLAVVLPYLAYGIGYIVGKNKKTFVVKHIPKIFYSNKNK